MPGTRLHQLEFLHLKKTDKMLRCRYKQDERKHEQANILIIMFHVSTLSNRSLILSRDLFGSQSNVECRHLATIPGHNNSTMHKYTANFWFDIYLWKPFPSIRTTIQQFGNSLSSVSNCFTYSNLLFAILCYLSLPRWF